MSLIDLSTSLPLVKEDEFQKLFNSKMSLKINPSDMKNYTNTDRKINTNNIFSNNRLGFRFELEDLTIGLDFKKKKMILDINRFFEARVATVIRDKEEKFIPKKVSLNKKSSNYLALLKIIFQMF